MPYRSALIVSALLLVTAGSANSQVLYGSIVGNVTDPSDAAIAGAEVTVVNTETNQSRRTTTDALGAYSMPTLQAGVYDIRVAKEGFSTALRKGVVVTINTVTRVDAALKVGAVTESVTVGANTLALQTDRSEVRADVVAEELVNLPVPVGRNYQQLFRALPGFSPPQNSHSIPTNPSRALAFNVNGTTENTNNTRIDGASSTHVQLPHVVAYIPSLESIETVNVVTNSFDAEQGLTGGAAINVQTKSGTNSLHGSGFEYHTNQHLKARPFFTPADFNKPKLVYNQFGGTIGGPIKKDKLFYFVAYEGTLDRRAAQRFGTVPTGAMRTGNMSASSRPVYDPDTGNDRGENRTPFAGNILPAARLSPIIRKLVDLTPAPNIDRLSNNYYAAAPFQFDRHTVDSKFNYNVTSKLTTFVRFSILRYNSYNQQLFGDQLGGPPIAGGNPGNSSGGTYSTTIAGTYTLAPNFIIDAYFGYTRTDTNSAQPRLDEKLGLDYLGIPGTNGPRLFEGGWPRFATSSFTTLGINEDYMPYYRRDPQYQYVANFNWTKGSHNIRFGFDLYRQHLNQQQAEFVGGAYHGAQGGFTFGGGPTSLRGGPASNQYNSYSTFLLGLPTRIGKILLVPDEYNERVWLYSTYIRDSWNVSRRLTLNYGFRWEYFPLPTRADRGIERYDPGTNKMLICGTGNVPTDCGVEISKRRFAPRLGLAYRVSDSFVVRAGYGITNDPFNATELLRANYPVLVPLNIAAPNSFMWAGRIENGIPPIQPPSTSGGAVDIPSEYAVGSVPQKYDRGYIQSWNFTLQKQLPLGFVAQGSYVATRSTRQLGYVDINAGQVIGLGEDGRPLNQRFGRTAETTFSKPAGTGQYNAFQGTLDRRFAAGLEIGFRYTWSKSIGYVDCSDCLPNVQATQYWQLNRAPNGYDRTHNIAITNIWELPFGRGKKWLSSGVPAAIAGGWQVNTLISMMTGTPFTVSASGDSLDLPGSNQRADQVLPQVEITHKVGADSAWFDPLAFRDVSAPRFGNSGFNTLRGPGLFNWDFGVFRDFRITERWGIQFRAEAFNFTNTPHFANPDSDVSAMQLGPNGTLQDLGGFATISSTTNLAREGIDERQIRFGLRIHF